MQSAQGSRKIHPGPTHHKYMHHIKFWCFWNQKGGYWVIAGRMGKYQAILLDNLNVAIQTVTSLNPATLMPTPSGGGQTSHDCLRY